MIRRDGHIHTPFCPHGSKDMFSSYIEQAIKQGFSTISFTEHAPLPRGFSDPVPDKDSGLALDLLPQYLEACNEMKQEYSQHITIYTGLEVDYIEGFEQETREFLDEWGPFIDDSILSLHFLQTTEGHYTCMDFSPESFEFLIKQCDTVEDVYKLYYLCLLRSIRWDLGPFKPKRLGHMTLVRKFQKLFPTNFDDSKYINLVLRSMKEHNMSLDVNAAGLVKQHCMEVYPPIEVLLRAKQLGIQCVYGSDSHQAKQIGIGKAELDNFI
ncbi:histidinol phosphatase [Salipaludibacillus neizhouensis]|uniref:Histidinol-phosphatase n=1 Tax=Salipaludibacillus neizhouensis TaxID=885475 RepID=A0A3A9K7B5_9BACI|nr:histidinol-phosphatase HisJ [Salipaludibacillus neizhouensis]RKL66740.1 histidinol phosphatase [Salipaludibacillus neizhouensis]